MSKYHIGKIDVVDVGRLITNSIVVSRLVGHKNPADTMTEYFHPDDKNITELFVKDFFLLLKSRITLDDFVIKWIPEIDIKIKETKSK